MNFRILKIKNNQSLWAAKFSSGWCSWSTWIIIELSRSCSYNTAL